MALKIFERGSDSKVDSLTEDTPIQGLTNPTPLDIVEEDQGIVGKDGIRRVFKDGAVTEYMPEPKAEEYTQTTESEENDYEAVHTPLETEEVIEKVSR